MPTQNPMATGTQTEMSATSERGRAMTGRSRIRRSARATRVSTPSPAPERVSRQIITATDASSATNRAPSTRSSSVMPLPNALTSPIDSSAF